MSVLLQDTGLTVRGKDSKYSIKIEQLPNDDGIGIWLYGMNNSLLGIYSYKMEDARPSIVFYNKVTTGLPDVAISSQGLQLTKSGKVVTLNFDSLEKLLALIE